VILISRFALELYYKEENDGDKGSGLNPWREMSREEVDFYNLRIS